MENLMTSGNLITVTADGIKVHQGYLDIIREHVDELAAQGIGYEEEDRRAEPITLSLLVTIVVTTTVTTTVAEIIKMIFIKWMNRGKTDSAPPTIKIEINGVSFALPQD